MTVLHACPPLQFIASQATLASLCMANDLDHLLGHNAEDARSSSTVGGISQELLPPCLSALSLDKVISSKDKKASLGL